MKRQRKFLVSALGVGTLIFLNLPMATAAYAATPAGGVSATMVEATIVSVISGPNSAGVDVVLLSTGGTAKLLATQVVKAQQLHRAAGGHATPDGSVSGNCGTSYINLYERSDGTPVRTTTGFNLTGGRRAVSYYWEWETIGPNGSGYDYYEDDGGGLALRSSWGLTHNSGKAYERGDYFAFVYPDSDALLDNGNVCVTGEPTEDRLL
jgi:hypothetical protein